MVPNGSKHKMNLSMQMKPLDENEIGMAARHHVGNSRNNHTRMPSLPSNIKGSIGGISGGPNNLMQLQTHQNIPNGKRNLSNNIPLNIAANDITFTNNYN